MEITILGCGPSYGIPTARFGFGSCDPNNPKNTRTRPGLIFSDKGTNILIDTPPELRQQLYNCNIHSVDAVVWTHMHADHVMGIDDARVFVKSTVVGEKDIEPLPIYIHENDWDEFKTRFSFYLKPFKYLKQSVPPFIPHLIKAGQKFKIKDIELLPILQNHSTTQTLGFKIDNFAYNTDLTEFVDFKVEDLKGIDLWILDCVTLRPNDKHLYLEK